MILVTGGTGLVGAHLLLQLVQQDSTVRAIYRDISGLEKIRKVFSYYTDSEQLFNQIEWVKADIVDLKSIEEALDGITHVYHCAALISFDPNDFPLLRKANAEGTANMVNLSLAARVKKFCYLSSIATIGHSPAHGQATEEEYRTDRFPNVYALSKIAAEMEVWRAAQEGLPVVILNPGIILGPGYWEHGSGRLFSLAKKGWNYCPPGGSGFVSVHDVVRLMMMLMQSTIRNERFIAVSDNLSYLEILGKINGHWGLQGPEKVLPIWVLEVLWRLDWAKNMLGLGRRRLTRSSVESLKHPVEYSSDKIKNELDFFFEPLNATIAFCCRYFQQERPELFA